jgi:hypothetical protein
MAVPEPTQELSAAVPSGGTSATRRRADVYGGSARPLRLLAERIEGLISQEHARWISSRRQHADAE